MAHHIIITCIQNPLPHVSMIMVHNSRYQHHVFNLCHYHTLKRYHHHILSLSHHRIPNQPRYHILHPYLRTLSPPHVRKHHLSLKVRGKDHQIRKREGGLFQSTLPFLLCVRGSQMFRRIRNYQRSKLSAWPQVTYHI